MAKTPRKNSLVRFDASDLPPDLRRKLPFRQGAVYIFLGEIANMPGHCVVASRRSGRILAGYHTENFFEIPVDEL